MKSIYVAHPLRGDVQRNKNAVTDICQNIKAIYPDMLILSPIHAFSFEDVNGPQDWVLGQCLRLIEKADELWLFGDWRNSSGCVMESVYARRIGKRVVDMTDVDMTDGEEAEANEAIVDMMNGVNEDILRRLA